MAAKLSGGGGRYAIRQNADINVTPFVDILMVLLVIFMVAVPTAVTSIKLDLPQASSQATPLKPVAIAIQNSGALFLSGQATRLDTLASDLSASFKANGQAGARGDQRVMISAQADVPYEALMGVINVVHRNGWTKVGIVNEDLH
ncbi:biopolymer transporter ExbD [Caulobacter sp.]|uniref:ExbD/TolR family protein n=1 Tax=Caulobacter sp. TaxID=78 RepID=UPI001B1C30DF|nr:biopolymer transporter ExbD [Caulobacter sp.]MBO9543981.1 biopolymer transporter ExbD [Caulobacter sp.]